MSINSSTDACDEAGGHLLLALGLFEIGLEMNGQMRRRDRREVDGHEIEARVAAWRQERPGAESGEAVGRWVAWPRPAV